MGKIRLYFYNVLYIYRKALKSYELSLNKIEGETLNKLSEDHYYGSGLNGDGEWETRFYENLQLKTIERC